MTHFASLSDLFHTGKQDSLNEKLVRGQPQLPQIKKRSDINHCAFFIAFNANRELILLQELLRLPPESLLLPREFPSFQELL